jgi:hypothetical protein
VTAASSYHFQFVAPDGMVIAGGGMFGTTDEPDAAATPPLPEPPLRGLVRSLGHGPTGPGSREVTAGRPTSDLSRSAFGTSASQGSVLGLNTHIADVPEADSYSVEVLVCPSPDGLLRACAVSAAFSAILLFLAAAFSHRLDGGRLDASIALLLVLPGVISTLLARPGEHHLVSRLLRGVRLLTLSSAICLYFAAAVVVAGVAGSALRSWWLALAVVSAVPAVLLGVAVRRCRRGT